MGIEIRWRWHRCEQIPHGSVVGWGPWYRYFRGMARFARLAGVVLAATSLSGAQDPSPVRFVDLLGSMTDLDRLWQAPAVGETNRQFSSYDRSSDRGPGDVEAWFGNADRGQFLRVERRGGVEQFVMVDSDGPGAVVRIWSANPSGRLFFYLDHEPEPRWTVDFKALTSGELAPFSEPLAGVRARGCNFHVPIPFAEHLQVTADRNDFYYQVNLRRWPVTTAVEGFQPEFLVEHAEAIAAAGARLADPALLVAENRQLRRRRGGGAVSLGDAAVAGEIRSWRVVGPVVIRELRLRLRPQGDPAKLRQLLRAVRLQMDVAGERTIDVPVADFFASAPGFQPHRGLTVGVTRDGWGVCRFPMPVRQSAEIRLVHDAPLPCKASYEFEIAYQPDDDLAAALLFRASWHQQRGIRTRPFSDFLMLDATGRGRFVGCALTVLNPTRGWWGEGDEKFYVDGESFPSTFGTGTEDYFGYAWCDPTVFSSPYHGQPQCDGPGNFGYTSVNRLQIVDDVPFQRSFKFDLEVWHWRDLAVDYAGTVYWYAAGGAQSGLPEMPPAAERQPAVIEFPKSYVAKAALEGEDLATQVSAGTVRRQDMSTFDTTWSSDGQQWWTGGKPGEVMTMQVPVGRPGRYQVEVALTKANDYAVVAIAIDGDRLGQPIDLFDPAVVPTGVLQLGVVELSAATAQLTFEILGKNDSARPGYMVGVDYLRLVPQ